MKVSRLSAADATQLAVKTLGLDEEVVDLLSQEALSASLRRAGSFLCPATPRQIVDAVLEAAGPLAPSGGPSRDDLMDLLDLLISAGDLLELRQRSMHATRLLFLGPPSYVVKEPGRYLLLGIRPFGAALVGEALASDVLYEGHTRTIELAEDTAGELLTALGLHEITREQWAMHPAAVSASEFLDAYRQRLDSAGPSGQVNGLTVIDSNSPVRYYRGRWRATRPSDSGDFVARRPQAYGADLWCFVRVAEGVPQRLVDLPVADATRPGHDEAWRLQAALDAERGQPQVIRTGSATGGSAYEVVDLFSPVPSWAERYLELVGLSLPRSKGSLFSYRVPTGAMLDLTAFLADMLWMLVSDGGRIE
ncbi:hypothetical protein [Micromonospora sp. NPDC000442]|uniref:hypothetical protein n=1 Tax=Micromonospora sp. NPDC000442 TaxID=3364217 RepID=UPI0036C021A5